MTDFISHNLAGLIKDKKGDAFRHLQIIEECNQNGTKFTDPEFPPDETSLIRRMETPAKWRQYVWRRAPDFMGRGAKVFDNIDPNDIKQGGLGDCYFLSCLAALAERPMLIQRLFLTEEPNEAGCYAVWLNANGEWKNFIIDDYFPCASRNSGAVFSRGNGPEMWVLLLEKAYAKLHGSYDIIEGGDPAWALRDLTGAPWDFLDSENPNDIWNFVKESDDKGYLLTCYTKSTDIREEQNPLGIVFGHAYSILDAKQVVTDYGAERLLRIRNPWGKFEWQGDWGDTSDKWTENVKSQVNYENKDDGTFWMSVNDFVRFYQGVGICKLHENYMYKSISFDHKATGRSRSIFRLVVPQATHIFLSVNQKDDRGFDPQTYAYEYSTVRLMIGRVEQNGLTYVGGKFYNDRNVVLESNLDAGYYIVTVEFYWRQNFYQQANINSYSERKVHFQEVINADYDLVERNLLKSYAIQNSNKVKDYGNLGGNQILKYTESHLGTIFLYYQNRDLSQKLQESVTLTKHENLQVQPPYYNTTEFNVEVLPQDDHLVLFKIVDERAAYSFGSSTQSRVTDASDEEINQALAKPYHTTTYIDDPNDKVSRDVSFYDDFIKDNKDLAPSFTNENIANLLLSKTKPAALVHPNAGISPRQEAGQGFDLVHGDQQGARGTSNQVGAINIDVQQGTTLPPRGSQQAGGQKMPAVNSLFDLRLWGNFPSYVADDSRLGSWSIFGFEKAFAEAVGPIIKSFSVDLIFLLLMLGVTSLMLLISLIRPMFVDIVLMTSMASLVISRFSVFKVFQEVNIGLRTYPLLWTISCALDFYWFWTYSTVWSHGDIIDSGILAGTKAFVIFLSIIHFFTKGAFTILLWWKVIVALKDKR